MATVTALIAEARTYTGNLLTSAQTALDDAKNLVSAVGYSAPGIVTVPAAAAPPLTLNVDVPTLNPVTLELPAEPAGAQGLQDIPSVFAGVLPQLLVAPPELTLPTKPSATAEFNTPAPTLSTDVVFPDLPAPLSAPAILAPEVTERASPVAPQVLLPVFDAQAPTDTTVAPTDLEGTFARAHAGAAPAMIASLDGYVDAMLAKQNPRYHEQMEAIEQQLSKYMSGGTALKPSVENAIYERSRDKTNAESRRVRDAAYGEAAERGFTIPHGVLMSSVRRARQDGADNNARASVEIAVAQAEMEQKNLQFAVTASAGLRSTVLNATLSYHQNLVSINGQALDYAKSILGAVVQTYNTAVQAFSARLDAYKADAMVYETRLKSAMAGIELFQVEVKALEALTNVDRAKVDVYRARIDGLRAYADVYKTQIEAVVSRASLEKLKIDMFQSQVQAYAARVQGKNAEWQAYSAEIGGEVSKAQVFRSQVDAYTSEVQGYSAGISAQAEAVRAAATSNKAKADQYTAAVQGFGAVVSARGEKARTELENERQKVLAFQQLVAKAVAEAQVSAEYYRTTSQVGTENARLQMQAMIADGDSRRQFAESIARLGIANADVYSSVAGSALAGMNTLATQSATEP